MKNNRNDSAVSPVIGVILMVAITVILAAVIAAFVFGMSGNIQKTRIVAVTVDKATDYNITALFQGGQDADSVRNLSMAINGGTPKEIANPRVGSQLVAQGTSGKDHVIVVGKFDSGSDQVLYDGFQ